MNQRFSDATALNTQLIGIAMGLQNCFAENRASIADVKYTVATEGCADRNALNIGIRDLITNGTANTQTVLDAIRGINDKLCDQELQAERRENDNLRQQLNMAQLAAAQTAQNAFIQQGFSNEVDALYNRLSSCPVPSTPVYGRTPIFACNNGGCGCGMA